MNEASTMDRYTYADLPALMALMSEGRERASS